MIENIVEGPSVSHVTSWCSDNAYMTTKFVCLFVCVSSARNALQSYTVRCAALAARIEDPYIDTTMKVWSGLAELPYHSCMISLHFISLFPAAGNFLKFSNC